MDTHPPDTQVKRVLEHFAGDQGRRNYLDLLAAAYRICRYYQWCGQYSGPMPGCSSVEDVVNAVVAQVLRPDANDPQRRSFPADVDVGVALRMHVRSKIDALAKSAENRFAADQQKLLPRSFGDGEEIPREDYGEEEQWDQAQRLQPPEEQRAEIRARCDRFIEFVRSDTVLFRMLCLIRDEQLEKPAEEVARRLGISVREVYAAHRRHQTAMGSFMKKERELQ